MTVASADHSRWLPPLAALIGGEVGFSSAGAGAMGAVALLNLTKLTPPQVVGTDMVFGLVLSILGGGLHFFGTLRRGDHDEADYRRRRGRSRRYAVFRSPAQAATSGVIDMAGDSGRTIYVKAVF